MKKMLAMMLAAATTMSVGITVFAEEIHEVEVLEDDSAVVASEPVIPEGSSSEEEEAPAAEYTGIQFGADEDGAILGETILEPGTEYKFPVYMVVDGATVALNDEMLDEHKFTYSKVSTNGMKRFEIEEYKGTYYLYVEAKDTTPTKAVDVKYNVKFVEKGTNLSVFSQEVKFQYGYEEMNSDYISDLDEGDTVEIDNNNPIITKSQFEKIAKINDYRNVTLSGPSWKFTVNVTDESTKNMVSNNAGIKEVLAMFPDQDFKFFSFAGKPTFAATGRVELDVDDIVDDFDKMYTYRYANGKLYRMSATFDGDENTLSFRTNRLDNFLVTNKLIEDGTVVTEADEDQEENNSGSNSSTDKNNPGTGASDMINDLVMASIAALAAGGVLAVKKLSK